MKAHPARLATQSEQFANELTQHLGISAPACRILRKLVRRQGARMQHACSFMPALPDPSMCHMAQGGTQAEWKDAHGAAMLLGRRGAELDEAMARATCCLVMEYVPGRSLFHEPQPFAPQQLLRTAEDLGR